MTLLSIEGLNAGYETGQVLFDVNVTVDTGEVVSILGRNGAGKTTTLRAILGLTPPDVSSGSIRFHGEEISDLEINQRADLGISIIPEGRQLWPRLTVEENIQMAINHVESPKEQDLVVSYFPELREFLDKKARNLSGGQQQMVAIARGFASNPDLMLLDEPSEGLAPFIVRDVEDAIIELNEEESVTILLVEQNAHMAMDVSDRHYILDQGQIVSQITPTELQSDEKLRQQYLSV